MNKDNYTMIIHTGDEEPELRFYKIMTGEIPIENESQRKDYEASYYAMNVLIPQHILFRYLYCRKLTRVLYDWHNLNNSIIEDLCDVFRVNMPLMLARLYAYYLVPYPAEKYELKTRLDKALVLYK